jgi:uDENN domain/Putative GTPase activating protein for Arf
MNLLMNKSKVSLPSKLISKTGSADSTSSTAGGNNASQPIHRLSSAEGGNININLLKLLKQVENRLCADCSTSLADTDIYGVINWGAWVCSKCADCNSFQDANDDYINDVKPVAMIRDPYDIQKMINAENNTKVNAILERYIPKEMTKIKPDCTPDDRLYWIKAKYESKMFLIPFKMKMSRLSVSSEETHNINNLIVIREKIPLPYNIVDYFTIVEAKSISYAPRLGQSIDSNSIETIQFIPHISSVYPSKSINKNNPIPDMISDFVFPNGLYLSRYEKPPHFFTFVLTNTNGVKIYGGVLHIYELIDHEQLSTLLNIDISRLGLTQSNPYYAPKALTVTSHYGFYNLFRVFLCQLYHISLSAAPLRKYSSYATIYYSYIN